MNFTFKSKTTITGISMLFLQFIECVVILFNLPLARQIIGFLYFTFVPGFVTIKLLKLYKLGIVEKTLLSIGLSIGLFVFLGLLTNSLGSIISISKPLTLIPLMVVLNIFILVCTIAIYSSSIKDNVTFWDWKVFRLHPSILCLMVFPILSIIGSIYSNTYGDNLILLSMMVAIGIAVIIGILYEKLLPPTVYPFAVLMIAIALLFHSSLVSDYIFPYASDADHEFFVFKKTLNDACWNLTNPFLPDVRYGRYYSMLSITIMPTMYSVLLNIEPTWVFKILIPFVFSLVPVVLYQLWKDHIGEKYAFIATFFFMSYETFYIEMIGLNRQMIGEFFFALLFFVILKEKITKESKLVCFFIFTFGLVTSHYGLAEVFLSLITLTFFWLFFIRKPSKKLKSTMIVFFFAVMFVWYIYTTSSAVFGSILEFGNYIYDKMSDFFNPSSRESVIYRGLGLESPPTVWHAISRIFAYITEFLIIMGFCSLILNKKNSSFKDEYFVLTFNTMAFLVALIIIPGLSATMRMTRFYHILLFFLAPLCILGGDFLFKLLKKHKESLVSIFLLFVLIPYFLFQTGFVFEIVGSNSHSVALSGYRMDPVILCAIYKYTYVENVQGAKWLSENVDGYNTIYSDAASSGLIAYGGIYEKRIAELSNITTVTSNEIVFLNHVNLFKGVVIWEGFVWNISDFSSTFDALNLLYSNGGCEIYRYSTEK